MNIKEAMQQYNEIRRQEKLIAEKKKELSKFLKEYAVEHGVKDATGVDMADIMKANTIEAKVNKNVNVNGDVENTNVNVVSTKIKFNQDKARAYMEEHYADYIQEVTRTVEYIDEDKLADLVAKEVLTLNDLEQMSDISTSYRVDLKEIKKEEEEESPADVTCKPRVKKMIKRARK